MQRLSVLSFGAFLLLHAGAQSAFGTVPSSTDDKDFFGNSVDYAKKNLKLQDHDASQQKTRISGANYSTRVLERADASSFAATSQMGSYASMKGQSEGSSVGNDREDAPPLRGTIPQPDEVETRLPLQCQYNEHEILDCFCCLSDQMGAIGRGDIFYGGYFKYSVVEVDNMGHDGQIRKEETRVWQVGGRTPGVVCDEGRLRCVCEDTAADWAVYESQCTDGERCAPRYGDLKSDVMDPENSDIGLFPWAYMSDMTMLADEVHEACVVRGLYAAKYKRRLRSCASQPAHDGSMETRVALGSGKCDHADLEVCGRFYSRIGCEWRLCEQRDLVKQCDAVPRYSQAVFKDDMLFLDQWYRLQRYSPNDAESMYDMFDLDGGGNIDINEWQDACDTLGLSPDNHCKELFAQLDRNGGGTLDVFEIVLLFRNSRALWDLTREQTEAMMAQSSLKDEVFKGHFKFNKNKKKKRSSDVSDSSLVEQLVNLAQKSELNMTRTGDAQISPLVDNGKSDSTQFQQSPRRNPKPQALPTARRAPSKKRDKK